MGSESTYSDEFLAKELGKGEAYAFTEIYNRYWKALFNTAYKILQDEENAQDTVQNVFVTLWAKREVTVFEKSLSGWLHQATRFLILKKIRSGNYHKKFEESLQHAGRDIVLNDPILFKDLERYFHSVLRTFPQDEREIFLLNREQGYTYPEIAAMRNISVKTVEKKMSSALKKLRGKFNEPLMMLLLYGVIK